MRDTNTWLRWTWEARATFALLMRKLDRSGRLPLDGDEPIEAIATQTGLPDEVLAVALPQLLRANKKGDATVVREADALMVPNFEAAQSAAQSDALRAQEYRERQRVTKRDDASRNVTDESQNVTDRHAPSQTVTDRHSSRAVLAEPSRAETLSAPQGAPLPRFDFAAIYARYPRKEGKAAGMAKLKSAIRTDADFAAFSAAADNYAAKVKRESTEPRYVLQWGTFCGGRWQDYVDGASALAPVTSAAPRIELWKAPA